MPADPRPIAKNFNLSESDEAKSFNKGDLVKQSMGVGVTLVVGAAVFLATRYKVSKPEQFLVRTGLGIRDMSISRTGIVFPFQDCK